MNPRNLYALMSDTAYSVQVKFQSETGRIGKVYDYVTNLPNIKVGDYAIVMAPNFSGDENDAVFSERIPKVVQVVSVDAEVTFNPTDPKAYGWLVGVVDFNYYNTVQAGVHKLELELKTIQRKRMREQFKAQMLALLADKPAGE